MATFYKRSRKTAEPVDLPYRTFGLWTRPKEAPVPSYSPGGAIVLSNEGTLAPSGEYELTIRLRRCGFMLN